MGRSDPERVIEEAIASWSSGLEAALFGTADPAEILDLLSRYVAGHLGSELDGVTFYRRRVGAVLGIRLVDGSEVVVKVHRPELVGDRLEMVSQLQQLLAGEGLPAPRPIASPTALAHGLATAEEMLDRGVTGDAHQPVVRRGLARGLHAFVSAATPFLATIPIEWGWPFNLPDDRLWPIPHDLRFDFSLSGGEWIDELAWFARGRLREPSGQLVIGHTDWRVENLRFEDARVVAIFDWDSVVAVPEPALVGETADNFTANWEAEGVEQLPSLEESRAFVADYEAARGLPFSASERETLDAAHLYALAYAARCEHSDATSGLFGQWGEEQGARALLRSRGDRHFL